MLCFCFSGVNPTKGQLKADVSGEVSVSFMFNSYFNDYKKSCCKFTSLGCILIVDNMGYAHEAYKGRIELKEYNGALAVKIGNLIAGDAGIYRCEIHGIPNYFLYKDFQIEVADRSPRLDPVYLFPKSTISSVTSLHHIAVKQQEPPRTDTLSSRSLDTNSTLAPVRSLISNSWSLKQTLGTVFGIGIIVLVVAIILGVAYHKKKARDPVFSTSPFSLDKCGRTLSSAPDIIPQPPQELNSIIYTTVDFKPYEDTAQLYANLGFYNTGVVGPDSDSPLRSQESVEYSTIARTV
ncbi:hypothetical protein NFI96_034710 [Prochilodus magdalenae]|nr:hypothetical protein NFI96_034710 [Prochilodus magdalenae]